MSDLLFDDDQEVDEIAGFGPVCRICACSDEDACVTNGVACHWVTPDLCSACAQ